MEKEIKEFEAIVVGGGQAGLAMGYYLRQLHKQFVILDAGEKIGASWQNRYDSLKLFTLAPFNGLAGLPFPGKRDYFPSKDEVAQYLQQYAKRFELPVVLQQKVTEVRKQGSQYVVKTADETYTAAQVIVCTGAFHVPFIPAFKKQINPNIKQLHSADYRRPSQLLPGKTLVVGGCNSGFQIAEELLMAGQEVYFSFKGKLIGGNTSALFFTFLFNSGLLSCSKYSWLGNKIQKRQEPIMSSNLDAVLQHPKLHLTGAALGATKVGIICERGVIHDVENNIWATGYTSDFSWIKLPVFDMLGKPVQHRGVTQSEGLYFLGLPWLHSRGSGLLGGVSNDAAYIAKHIAAHF
ncbi:flavin-containing monooxygenase [Pontibacter harenae]|uniref:flavin-containing monooxygenase n=1 Tax=Pontibacter harenae TaxID=2894083 RepID=UPI001E41F7AA|nr:NAD(P)/FAD-dependent oxidoreductase [Pontibacter harenae]MCC9166247.1 NAD(P)/FAD-dependent oxidoreductase [Pontibacter harenae]